MSYDKTQALFIAFTMFALVLSLWLIGTVLWSRRRLHRERKLEKLLDLSSAPQPQSSRTLRLWHNGRAVETNVTDLRTPWGVFAFLTRRFAEAGYTIQGQLAVAIVLLSGLALVFVSYTLMQSPLAGLGVWGTALVVAWIYLERRIIARKAKFDNQLSEALQLASQSLRAGHSLTGAFRFISEEVAAPVGPLFGEVCQRQDLGATLEEALNYVTRDTHSDDLQVLVAAVIIQVRTGGNLAEMMDRVAFVIRDRLRLSRRVRSLTAQTQLSKRILLVIPPILFVAMNVLNPNYMDPMYKPEGQWLIGYCVASMLLGAWVMNRMVVLRY